MIKMVLLLFVASTFYSCENFEECNNIERNIIDMCSVYDSTYTIPIASIINLKWDTLYVINGPTIDNEVADCIGTEYKKIIPDGRRHYIFVKDNTIIKEYSSYCNCNLSKTPTNTICQKFTNNSVLKVKKRKGETNPIFNITW